MVNLVNNSRPKEPSRNLPQMTSQNTTAWLNTSIAHSLSILALCYMLVSFPEIYEKKLLLMLSD